MDAAKAADWVFAQDRDASPAWRAALLPAEALSLVYGGLVRSRAMAYERDWIASRRAPVPVIVCGNLTVGGSGKTPLAMWLAAKLLERGRRCAIVSRGYGARIGAPLAVSDGSGPLVGPGEGGDEPVMMAEKLKGAPIIASPKRIEGVLMAAEKFGSDIVVLDDGYQHLALDRDVNILVVDSEKDPARQFLLPRGPLREPPSAARRADIVVYARCGDRPAEGFNWLSGYAPAERTFAMRHLPAGARRLGGGEEAGLQGRKVYGLCGVGNPGAFKQTLERSGAEVVGFEAFPDHHRYRAADLAATEKNAASMGAEALAVTEKDAVKIDPAWAGMPLFALAAKSDFFGRDNELVEAVETLAKR